jgi:hypothetical protein
MGTVCRFLISVLSLFRGTNSPQLAQLTTIALNENLEGWWYPVWTFKLLPYVAAGYGGTPNLSICPQPALRDPATGANPYVYPDFAMIDSFGGAGGAPVGRNLRLVMENKRTASWGQMIQAQLDCEFYATYAISAFNFPANPISFVATAGRFWTWRQAAHLGGGAWAWAVVWTWGGNEVAPFQGAGAPLNI